MSHPLEAVIRGADGFLLIGDSESDRFPATSYNCYTRVGKRFYCLDLGGLAASRGFTKGGAVYTSLESLPEDRDDLAVIWVHPFRAVEAIELAHRAGCRRVWLSFGVGHPDALARAGELGMEVVEIGRCPVFYLEQQAGPCRVHTALVKLSGARARPPQRSLDEPRRELL